MPLKRVLSTHPKWWFGVFVVTVVALMIVLGHVADDVGVMVIVGVAAGLGVYETGKSTGRMEERSRIEERDR